MKSPAVGSPVVPPRPGWSQNRKQRGEGAQQGGHKERCGERSRKHQELQGVGNGKGSVMVVAPASGAVSGRVCREQRRKWQGLQKAAEAIGSGRVSGTGCREWWGPWIVVGTVASSRKWCGLCGAVRGTVGAAGSGEQHRPQAAAWEMARSSMESSVGCRG